LSGIAGKIHSELPLFRRLKKTTQFCFNGMRDEEEFRTLQRVFDTPELAEVLQLCPAILEKPFSPYVHIEWDSAQRYKKIQNNFLFLKELFGKNAAEIYKPQGYKLFEFKCQDEECYTVELFPGYQNEGSIGIRLCDEQKREIYALSLHLSGGEENVCYIGALQGPNDRIPDKQKVIVSLTRSLHGLRPKALMIETLYMVADSFKINGIYGISNDGNIYNSEVYSDKKTNPIHFDRDQMWLEYQAERISDYIFLFPAAPIRKDIASLKSNKRSMYRKRYAWLAQARLQTADAICRLLIEAPDCENLYEIKKAA